jgi:hypothetical protein
MTLNSKSQILIQDSLPINSLIGLIFMFLSPIYALFVAAVLTLGIKSKVNNLWVGSLYTFSFTLLFYEQDYSIEGDVHNYISLYGNSILYSYEDLFFRFSDNFSQNEFLWFAYTKALHSIFNNDPKPYIFVTYFIIFGLSAYLAHLVSKSSSNKNYLLFLFYTIFINMSFQYSAYFLWRHTISSLLFLIGIVKFNTGSSNIIPRIIIYSSAFIQIVTIPLIFMFELYKLLDFSTKNNYKQKLNYSYLIKLGIICALVIILYTLQTYILQFIFSISNIQKPLKSFTTLHLSLNYQHLISPLPILFIIYFFINRKNLLYHEVFILISYIMIVLSPLFIRYFPSTLHGRMTSSLIFIISLIAIKSFPSKGLLCLTIISIVFIYRLVTFLNPVIIGPISSVGYGNYANPFYGILSKLVYFEAPL